MNIPTFSTLQAQSAAISAQHQPEEKIQAVEADPKKITSPIVHNAPFSLSDRKIETKSGPDPIPLEQTSQGTTALNHIIELEQSGNELKETLGLYLSELHAVHSEANEIIQQLVISYPQLFRNFPFDTVDLNKLYPSETYETPAIGRGLLTEERQTKPLHTVPQGATLAPSQKTDESVQLLVKDFFDKLETLGNIMERDPDQDIEEPGLTPRQKHEHFLNRQAG